MGFGRRYTTSPVKESDGPSPTSSRYPQIIFTNQAWLSSMGCKHQCCDSNWECFPFAFQPSPALLCCWDKQAMCCSAARASHFIGVCFPCSLLPSRASAGGVQLHLPSCEIPGGSAPELQHKVPFAVGARIGVSAFVSVPYTAPAGQCGCCVPLLPGRRRESAAFILGRLNVFICLTDCDTEIVVPRFFITRKVVRSNYFSVWRDVQLLPLGSSLKTICFSAALP